MTRTPTLTLPSTCRACVPKPPALAEPVTIRAVFTSWTGYGQIAEWLARGLEALGHRVVLQDYGYDECYYDVTPWVRERFDTEHRPDWCLHLAPPDCPYDRSVDTVVFSMWESTGLPKGALSLLNAAKAVIVPSTWNARTFRESGVTAPVYRCPMGVSASDGYYPRPMGLHGPTTFGMAARVSHGGGRKGIQEGIKAFLDAFPTDPDVRLVLKLWPDCLNYLAMPRDPRISVLTLPLRALEMGWWYAGLTALLVPSKGEGWGLHTHQAMACGRPVIAAKHSGTADFFEPGCGWEVGHAMAPAKAIYEGTGDWAVPDHGGMVDALRAAHADRAGCARKGVRAAVAAGRYPWERSALELETILTSLGVLRRPAAERGRGGDHP